MDYCFFWFKGSRKLEQILFCWFVFLPFVNTFRWVLAILGPWVSNGKRSHQVNTNNNNNNNRNIFGSSLTALFTTSCAVTLFSDTQSQTHARSRWVRNSPDDRVFQAGTITASFIPSRKSSCAFECNLVFTGDADKQRHEAHGSGKAVESQRECG